MSYTLEQFQYVPDINIEEILPHFQPYTIGLKMMIMFLVKQGNITNSNAQVFPQHEEIPKKVSLFALNLNF